MAGRTLSELRHSGIELTSEEAVAVAQQLIASTPAAGSMLPRLGPPSLENVRVLPDGSVQCGDCGSTLEVPEIGALLAAMLPPGGRKRVAGALRYIIARALQQVDAPRFDSLDDLSKALSRHEGGASADVARQLYSRAVPTTATATTVSPNLRVVSNTAGPRTAPVTATSKPGAVTRHWGPAAPAPRTERRRRGPSVTDLRRQLREADQALFDRAPVSTRVTPPPARPVPVPAPPLRPVPVPVSDPDLLGMRERPSEAVAIPPSRRSRLGSWLLAGAAAALIAFAAGYLTMARLPWIPRGPVAEFVSARNPVAPAPATPPNQKAVPPPQPTAAPAPVPSVSTAGTVDASPAVVSASGGRPDASSDRASAASEAAPVRAVSPSTGPTFSPSFAPTGTALFFHNGTSSDSHSSLQAADLTGEDLRVMTIVDDGSKNYHVRPSPDGTQVAFDSDRDGDRGVYVANRDGTDAHRISGPGYAAVPTWSPDGTMLAYIRAEPDRPQVWNLWLLDLTEHEFRRLTSYRFGQTWAAAWFPDGRRIGYSHEDRLVVRDLDGRSIHEYASPVARTLVRTPAVSPDGEHVIFQVSGSGAWLLDLADGSMRRVLTDPTAEEFAWAPDGRRVAFHSRRDGQWGIWLMTPAMKAE